MGSPDENGRVYVGNLPSECDQREIEDEFEKFGRIKRCDIKKGVNGASFAFVEFEDPRDARDAIKEKDGYEFKGSRLRVEVPFSDRGYYRRRPAPRRGHYTVEVLGLPPSGSWQDLKDHMRDAGECGHADVFRGGVGEVSFFLRRDMEAAIEMFDGSTFRSHEGEKAKITVREKRSRYRNPSRSNSRPRRRCKYIDYSDRSRSRSRSRSRRSRTRSVSRSRSRSRTRSRSYSRRR